jgi:glycine cleavage system transcriptional repressor
MLEERTPERNRHFDPLPQEISMSHFALTIIGRDRPGIVSQVTEILYRLGCNIADSSCSILGGQFAMILIISHPACTDRESFGDAFAPLEESGLSVFLRTLKPGGEKHPKMEGEICMISVYGSDKPGIVYRVARELGERGVNITDLNTKLVGSEARPVYVMMLEAVLPPDLSEEELADIMNGLKEELQVDISVRSIAAVEL